MNLRSLLILLLLVAALFASSLVLVRTSYDSRRVFTELDRARAVQRKLDAEFKRLDAEAQAQATHLRVEKLAREKLGMRTPSPAVTEPIIDSVATGSYLASNKTQAVTPGNAPRRVVPSQAAPTPPNGQRLNSQPGALRQPAADGAAATVIAARATTANITNDRTSLVARGMP